MPVRLTALNRPAPVPLLVGAVRLSLYGLAVSNRVESVLVGVTNQFPIPAKRFLAVPEPAENVPRLSPGSLC